MKTILPASKETKAAKVFKNDQEKNKIFLLNNQKKLSQQLRSNNQTEQAQAPKLSRIIFNKTVLASMIGNSLEWFEYCIYGNFANIIAISFFPKGDLTNMIIWLIFASGFIIRPIGGLILGFIGDKYGRKSVLTISILAMALPTLGIGILPTYNIIGIFAPILLLIFRLIQGFSMGGEFSSCIIYLVETCPDKNRGVVGSISFVSMCFGILIGLFSYNLIFKTLQEDQILSWGWRMPFVCGIFMGLIGMYIRTQLKESKIFQEMQNKKQLSTNPIRDAFFFDRKNIILGMALYTAVTGNFYMFGIYLQHLLTINFDIQTQISNKIVISGLIAISLVMPIAGYLSDIFGRKKTMLFGIILMMASVFMWIFVEKNTSSAHFLIIQTITCMSLGIYMGPIPATLVEMFPAKTRFTSVGLSYNISAAIFGGTLPIISTYILQYVGNVNFIWGYLFFLNCIGFIAVIKYKESHNNMI